MGNQEIKPINKTKEDIVAGFSIRLITQSHACELVIEVETDFRILLHNQDQSEAPCW